MVPTYDDYRGGRLHPQRSKLAEGVLDCEIAGANDVEQVAGNQDQVGVELNCSAKSLPEGLEDVGLASVKTRRVYPVVGPVS